MQHSWSIPSRRWLGQGIIAIEDKDKANVLADFYSSVFTNEPSGAIPNPKPQHITSVLHKSIFTEEKIKKKLLALKTAKSPGPDKIHPRVLKEVATAIAKPLYWIFSSTMEKRKLPTIFKRANVSPIFKKGNRQLATNYRPVSLTCISCKLQESMICQWMPMALSVISSLDLYQDDQPHCSCFMW